MGEVVLNNHTVYSGNEKKVPMLNGYVSYTGPANFTLSNSHFSTKTPLETDWSTIWLKGISPCNPNDGRTQFWNHLNNTLTLPVFDGSNWYIDQYSIFDAS